MSVYKKENNKHLETTLKPSRKFLAVNLRLSVTNAGIKADLKLI